MGDESIWKKEVSFGRKSEPKDEATPETPAEVPAVADSAGEPEAEANKETLWKREVSFEPKPAPTDAEAETETSEASTGQKRMGECLSKVGARGTRRRRPAVANMQSCAASTS